MGDKHPQKKSTGDKIRLFPVDVNTFCQGLISFIKMALHERHDLCSLALTSMKRWVIATAILVGLIGGLAGSWFVLKSQRSHHGGHMMAVSSLKSLATAEADFRGNDRTKSGKHEYWRKDVAGLWGLIPMGGSEREFIILIELSVALADERPSLDLARVGTRQPRSGYWFRAIRKKDEPPLKTESQFAFCAFPASYNSDSYHRYTFIIDEGNTVFRADRGHGRGIETFPDEEELKREWTKLD